MRLTRCILPILGLIVLCVSSTGFSQVAPQARSTKLPLTVGAGISYFNADWDNSTIKGSTLWIDYYPGRLPHFLNGLGVDLEGRDLSWGRSSGLPAIYRQDTAAGGLIYSWHHFANFRPYVKGLYEHGSFDFNVGSPTYHHDTRSIEAMGAGVDVRVFRHIWARGDYEYQIWQPLFGKTTNLTPNGFTFGALYDFRPANSR